MGGFLLRIRNEATEEDDAEQDRRSLNVFSKKGLTLDSKISKSKFIVYRFRKLLSEHEHVIEFENGDFVLCTGTMAFRNAVGRTALSHLYDAFDPDHGIDEELNGQFSVTIYKNGKLSLFTDYARYYPVYVGADRTLFSNSFLAVAAIGSSTISPHELYEYLLHGIFVGENTLLRDVQVLDSRPIHGLLPSVRRIARNPPYRAIPLESSFDDATKQIANDLREYFSMLGGAFGKTIGTALSGGYDSRLQLALLRRTGCNPVIHVYGDADSMDVRVAKDIGQGENITIDHIDKNALPRPSPDDFPANLERALYFFDGLLEEGMFNDAVDLTTRIDRARKAPLQLHGGCGEIYREIWNLGNRNVKLRTFLRMRNDLGNYPFWRAPFNLSEYFDVFTAKVQRQTLGIDRSWITRREAEMLLPFLRGWTGATNLAANNQISYAIEPFLEPRFIFPSFDLPIHFKYCAKFQANLIKEIDPALAKYNSQYGINFSDPIPTIYRLKAAANRMVPLPVRLLKRRLSRGTMAEPLPYYLRHEYLQQVLDMGRLRISEFIDVSKINDPMLLSRALSVELILQTINR